MAALTVGEELFRALLEKGPGGSPFPEVWLRGETQRALASSLMSGRHLLLLGPPGCGKTRLAQSLSALLPPLTVVKDCPVNCCWEEPRCPWCGTSLGKEKEKEERPGEKRWVQAVGSNALQWEELLGEMDPVLGMRFGPGDLRSFVPGRLLRANHGLLLLDHIESIPPRTLNSLLQRLEAGGIQLAAGTQEIEVPLDLLVVGIGSPRALATLSANLLDHFDVIRMDPPQGVGEKKEVVERIITENENGLRKDLGIFMTKTLELAGKIDRHPEVEQGVSSRGTIRCLELLGTLPQVNRRPSPAFEDFREAALLSFPHRLRLKGSALSRIDPMALVDQLVRQFEEEEVQESPAQNVKYLLIARELAQSYALSHPLRWGHHGLLLRRIKNNPQSQLAQFYQEMLEELRERQAQGERLRERKERFLHEMEILEELEAANPERELEENALEEALERLGRAQVIRREGEGWTFHREAVRQLLNELLPQEAHRRQALSSFEGRHLQESQALFLPRERLPEIRRYQRGDRYRDLSLRATLREAVRRRREIPLRGTGPVPLDEPGSKEDEALKGVQPADLRVYQRGKAFRLDIMLALDLSGTMRQGEKLWYAKEAVGALAHASSLCRDRVGLVTFSNLATLVLGPVADPVRVMEKAIDLWVRRNAFTNLGQALKLSREACLRSRLATTVPHIILISDGQATAPFSDPKGFALREAAAAQRSRVTISCVCLMEGSNDVELMRRISQIGRGRLFLVEDVRSLPEVIRQEQAALKRS